MGSNEAFTVYAETIDYSAEFDLLIAQLGEIQTGLNELISAIADIQGIFIFFTVVIVCFLSYKFFRIFF